MAGSLRHKLRMQEHRQHAHRAIAAGNLRGIQTGHTFQLTNHASVESNRGWLVLGTEYEMSEIAPESGKTLFEVKVRFLVQPDIEQVRPDRVIQKPLARPQSAVVVGPEGREIWTNEYSRVKIRFHWHREDPANENSSCWVRVTSPWAGSNYGGIQIPRVGQEVIVDFLNSDYDMPYLA